MTMLMRQARHLVRSRDTSDGAGVRLKRSIGGPMLDHLDPFLLLDEFGSEDGADYVAGFPDHPHRGFETVTYMLAGKIHHRDSRGHSGILLPGGVQWMTAGRGIVHSEMPAQEDGLLRGFQLWVNLPTELKMCEPRYQNIEPRDIPEIMRDDGVRMRVIAGRVDGVEGAVHGIAVDPLYLDLEIPPGTVHRHPLPAGHTAFCYPFEGDAVIGGTVAGSGVLVALGDGDAVDIGAGERGARLLLVAGRPLGEPIARHGPFVMNTAEEIAQAIEDYQGGNL